MNNISLFGAVVAAVGAALGVVLFLFRPSLIKNNVGALKASSNSFIALVAIFILLSAGSYWSISPVGNLQSNDVVAASLKNATSPSAHIETKATEFPINDALTAHDDLWNKTTRDYIRRFPATPGYRIIKARFEQLSSSRAEDIRIIVDDDGAQAVLLFRLTSGPQSDRYIGQLTGRVSIMEKKAPNPTVNAGAAR